MKSCRKISMRFQLCFCRKSPVDWYLGFDLALFICISAFLFDSEANLVEEY